MKVKYTKMNTIKLTASAMLVLFLAACGSSVKQDKDDLSAKKARLEKLKEQQSSINEQITALEEEIAKVDTSVAQVNAKLVEITPVSLNHFTHYIDLQGRIDAENIAYVTPRGQGGQVKEIYVKQGDYVKNGQLLMKLDNAVVKQQIDQLKVQLNLAVIARFRLEGKKLAFNQDIFPSSKFNLGELHKALIEHFLFGVASSKGYKLIVKYQQERIKINQ